MNPSFLSIVGTDPRIQQIISSPDIKTEQVDYKIHLTCVIYNNYSLTQFLADMLTYSTLHFLDCAAVDKSVGLLMLHSVLDQWQKNCKPHCVMMLSENILNSGGIQSYKFH